MGACQVGRSSAASGCCLRLCMRAVVRPYRTAGFRLLDRTEALSGTAARFDELLGRAATVGVCVGHGAAQLLDEWRVRRGPFGSLPFPAVQVGFGGLAGGEEQPARRSGALAVTGNRDHAGRVSVTAPVFPVRAVLPRVPVPCAPHAAGVCRAVLAAAAGRGAVTVRGREMNAVAVAAAVPGAHQASGDIPRALIAAPGVGLELLAADAAGADNGFMPVPAVAGVVDQRCRLLDDWHLLDPAAGPGRVAVVAGAGAGDGRTGIRRVRRRWRRVPAAGPSARRRRSASAQLCVPVVPWRDCAWR